MRRRTEDAMVGGLIALAVLAWVAMVIVFVILARAMFHTAERGDTAMTVAYGVILLVLASSGWGSSRRSK